MRVFRTCAPGDPGQAAPSSSSFTEVEKLAFFELNDDIVVIPDMRAVLGDDAFESLFNHDPERINMGKHGNRGTVQVTNLSMQSVEVLL